MKTHNGNVGKVLQDIAKITIDTLEKFDIPYDELYFGKPYADFYVDDLAVNANFDLEKELGIYKTDIQERNFNELSSSKIEVITKRSQSMKIKGEIYWYRNIPINLRDLFPALINYGNDFYVIEKINGITLSYLYVNESLSISTFTKFLECIHRLHRTEYENDETIDIYDNYLPKLEERYKNYDYSKLGSNIDTIYQTLCKNLKSYQDNKKGRVGIIHGDPVLSNVLLDTHNNIKFIDMRGMVGNKLTLQGDIFYDYAKIYQSLIGYDEILLSKMISSKHKKERLSIFEAFVIGIYGEDAMKTIKLLTDSLLFTLIPLHDNEKCKDYLKLIQLS